MERIQVSYLTISTEGPAEATYPRLECDTMERYDIWIVQAFKKFDVELREVGEVFGGVTPNR